MSGYGFFLWPMLASVGAAVWLSLMGVHAAARGQMVQVMTGAQSSLLGILAGLWILQSGEQLGQHGHDWIPLLGGLVFCAASLRALKNARDPLLVGLFCALMATSQVLTKLVPGLETHHAHAFIGDLSSMADLDAKIVLGVSGIGLFWILALWKPLARETFEVATYGRAFGANRIYSMWILVAVAVGVQFLGFLFTTAALALPTALWRWATPQGTFRAHVFQVGGTALLGTFGGYAFSLWRSNIPTAPSVVIGMLAIAVLGGLLARLIRPGKRS